MMRTYGLFLSLLAGVALADSPGETASPAQKWAKRLTGYVTMADGARLRYSVLLPKAEGRFPIVLNYNGYDAGVLGGAAYRAGTTVMSKGIDDMLLENGYALMGLNIRGTSCSSGQFELFDARWGEDGAAAVEWAAAQPWSTGSVGMVHWSFSGLSQLAVAAQRPPHLKAIAPGMIVADPIRDVSAPGGVLNQIFPHRWWFGLTEAWIKWMESAQADGDTECATNTLRNLAVAQRGSPLYVQGFHRHVDEWTVTHSYEGRTEKIDIPVLSIEAWQDEATGVRGGHFRRTLDPQKTWYIAGNGGHGLYPNKTIRPMLLAFFDRFLKDTDNGFDRGPHATLLMEMHTSEQSKSPDDAQPAYTFGYPQAELPVRPMVFDLAARGELSTGTRVRKGVDRFDYPVPGPTVNAGKGGWGQQESGWKKGSLHYTTPPLKQGLLLAGGASADLWVAVNTVDADLQVTLTEVRSDGREQYVQRGWLRLSDRALDQARSTPLVPWLKQTHEAVQPLTPGEPVLARVEINRFAHAFRAGSRLRLWLDAPSTTGSFGFLEPRLPATISVIYGGNRASKLVVGVLEPSASIPAVGVDCDRVLRQPCRPDPLTEVHTADTSAR